MAGCAQDQCHAKKSRRDHARRSLGSGKTESGPGTRPEKERDREAAQRDIRPDTVLAQADVFMRGRIHVGRETRTEDLRQTIDSSALRECTFYPALKSRPRSVNAPSVPFLERNQKWAAEKEEQLRDKREATRNAPLPADCTFVPRTNRSVSTTRGKGSAYTSSSPSRNQHPIAPHKTVAVTPKAPPHPESTSRKKTVRERYARPKDKGPIAVIVE